MLISNIYLTHREGTKFYRMTRAVFDVDNQILLKQWGRIGSRNPSKMIHFGDIDVIAREMDSTYNAKTRTAHGYLDTIESFRSLSDNSPDVGHAQAAKAAAWQACKVSDDFESWYLKWRNLEDAGHQEPETLAVIAHAERQQRHQAEAKAMELKRGNSWGDW